MTNTASPTNVTIRQLSIDDYDAICAVWAASGVGYQVTGRESREAFAAQMNSGIQVVLGAMLGDQIVGVTVLTHDGRKGWINRLGVLPEFQRRGIGKALITAADAKLHEMGLSIIAALVEHYNDASLALFKSAGFHVHETYYVTKRDRADV